MRLFEPFFRYNFGNRSRLKRTFFCQQLHSSGYPSEFFAGYFPFRRHDNRLYFPQAEPDREARFSFLLSLPAVCGAVILETRYFKQISSSEIWLYFAGFIWAALAGLVSLKLFFLVIREARLKFFAYYWWIFGLFTLLVKSSFF